MKILVGERFWGDTKRLLGYGVFAAVVWVIVWSFIVNSRTVAERWKRAVDGAELCPAPSSDTSSWRLQTVSDSDLQFSILLPPGMVRDTGHGNPEIKRFVPNFHMYSYSWSDSGLAANMPRNGGIRFVVDGPISTDQQDSVAILESAVFCRIDVSGRRALAVTHFRGDTSYVSLHIDSVGLYGTAYDRQGFGTMFVTLRSFRLAPAR